MKKQFKLLAFSATMLLATTVTKAQTEVTLRQGAIVQMEVSQDVTSKGLQPGSTVDLRVKYDVKANDKVVIYAGSTAKATVTMAKRAKGCGKAGVVEIKAVSCQTVDGQMVQLYSSPVMKEGENKKGLAWGLSVGGCFVISPLSFFFLLIKGEQARIPAGTTLDGTTTTAVTVKPQ